MLQSTAIMNTQIHLKAKQKKEFPRTEDCGERGITKTPSWKSFQWKVENKRNVRKQAGKQKNKHSEDKTQNQMACISLME